MEERATRAQRRALRLLAIGASAGLVLAAASLLEGRLRVEVLPEGVVARVNETLIRSDDFERLLAGLADDKRSPLDDSSRRHVLDRMIEEELLVQHALELGLAQVDRRVRANLTAALIASVVAAADAREPGPGELERFFEANRAFFASPPRVRVNQIFFRVSSADAEPAARARAELARRRLAAGERFSDVRSSLGDREISPIPDTYLPPAKLRDYLGPTALRAALTLEPGATSEVVRSGTGLHLLRLKGRDTSRSPDLETSLDQVRAEWRRRAGDEALRAYLEGLRSEARVVVGRPPG